MAVQYFQPATGRHRPDAEEEEELAAQLLTILNQKYTGPLDFISSDPLGRLDDGLPADQEKIGGPFDIKDSLQCCWCGKKTSGPQALVHFADDARAGAESLRSADVSGS